MPIVPFGEWAPDIGDYENPGGVSDVDFVYPSARGYEPWGAYHTARPNLPQTALDALSVFSEIGEEVFLLGTTDLYVNPVTASATWLNVTPAATGVDIYFTVSGGNNVMKSATTQLVHVSAFQKILISGSVFNNGTRTVLTNLASFTTPTIPLRRIEFESAVTSETAGATIIAKGIYSTTENGWCSGQYDRYAYFTTKEDFPTIHDLFWTAQAPNRTTDHMQTPFKAGACGTVGEFVVFGDIQQGVTPNVWDASKIWWSAIGDPFDWTVDTATQCGNASLPERSGTVIGIASGEYGLILCENAIHRMVYIGPPTVWQIDIAFQNIGPICKNAWASNRELLFFAARSGFKMVVDGSTINDIGKDRVDEFFFNDIDMSDFDHLHCAIDIESTRVFWSYRTNGSSFANRILCFDWALNKWSKRTRVSADPTHSVIYEDFSNDGRKRVGVLDNQNLKALAQTVSADSGNQSFVVSSEYEHNPGGRSFVRGIRPIYEGVSSTPSVSLLHRESMGLSSSVDGYTAVNRFGEFPTRTSSRYMKYRIAITGEFGRILGFQTKVSNEGEL